MKLVQVMLPKALVLQFKSEALQRETSLSIVLSAYLEQTAKGFDFGQLVVPERSEQVSR